jgi:aryl-alcohol dehydrogenase-like predicted oxidoreductase
MLDTAAAYGDAEATLGRIGVVHRFRIVTKTLLSSARASDAEALNAIEERFARSMTTLSAPAIEAVLVHAADDLLSPWGASLWRLLQDWKNAALVRRIGVSVYGGADLDRILAMYRPDIVQLPLNALDQRAAADGILDQLADSGIAAHVRSAFLQGLLLSRSGETPTRLRGLDPSLDRWREACHKGGVTPAAAALAYAGAHPAVERVIVGVQTEAQLTELIDSADAEAPDLDWPRLACPDQSLVDPRFWPTA